MPHTAWRSQTRVKGGRFGRFSARVRVSRLMRAHYMENRGRPMAVHLTPDDFMELMAELNPPILLPVTQLMGMAVVAGPACSTRVYTGKEYYNILREQERNGKVQDNCRSR